MHHNDFFSFETGQATDVGCRREVNEDNFLSRGDYGLWVVADGMGGHAAGDFASLAIVQQLNSVGVPASADDLQARFMERLTRANDEIITHAEALGRGTIGATVVSLLVHDQHFACIWSGDSRAYLLRHDRLSQQSRDHTEVRALLDAGTISEHEALHWPRKNVITRAIGVTAQPQCDIVVGALQEGDVFLLCSDGLTEHLSDTDIAYFLRSHAPQQACDAMVAETLARGARDNVTVIVVRCGPPPLFAEEEDSCLSDSTGEEQ
ncbi:serine/threonine protein phosphatase [Thioclava sp. SK-1]|uniref:PP2C family protein-serine/threonine phosphatase n=1 Tax=Thioclava sp. SK-1 TaxID=1889770 RepID=UPI000824EAD8|nr:SpoIIE family protein phosphatase [Thioclava sp. SK-1]OCX58185.1 serine/threonine protein phosphatase [Thioclava sp. SK-1]